MRWIRLAKKEEIRSSCLIMLILKYSYIHASKWRCQTSSWITSPSQGQRLKLMLKNRESSSFRLTPGMGSSNNTEEKKISGNADVRLLDCSSEEMWIKCNQDKRKQWKGSWRFICPSLFNASQYHLLFMEYYLVRLEKKNEFHY